MGAQAQDGRHFGGPSGTWNGQGTNYEGMDMYSTWNEDMDMKGGNMGGNMGMKGGNDVMGFNKVGRQKMGYPMGNKMDHFGDSSSSNGSSLGKGGKGLGMQQGWDGGFGRREGDALPRNKW